MPGWRFPAALLLLAAYALLSNWLMLRAPTHPLTVAALFSPLLGLMAWDALRRRRFGVLVLCALATAGLAWAVQRGGDDIVGSLYVLQHGAIHLALAWTFGVSLKPGATPLITQAAALVHEQFTPPMRAYTRRLTAAWAVYFVAMTLLSLGLYALAPWSWWSVYCSLVTPLAAGALFVGDHLWRRWRHPEFERVTLSGAVRAYRASRAVESR
jgi:uncharacterized membrane protein